MPLPLTASCFSTIQIGFTFLARAHPGSPGKRAVKRVYVNCNFRPTLSFRIKLYWLIGWSSCRRSRTRRATVTRMMTSSGTCRGRAASPGGVAASRSRCWCAGTSSTTRPSFRTFSTTTVRTTPVAKFTSSCRSSRYTESYRRCVIKGKVFPVLALGPELIPVQLRRQRGKGEAFPLWV